MKFLLPLEMIFLSGFINSGACSISLASGACSVSVIHFQKVHFTHTPKIYLGVDSVCFTAQVKSNGLKHNLTTSEESIIAGVLKHLDSNSVFGCKG